MLDFYGRLTLVKHTLSMIPVYLFSVFRARGYFVSKIRSVIIRFFWGGNEEGGISWMRWSNLCKPLGQGGLGLRDLNCFNQALLAKVAWRLFVNKDSLMSRVMLGRYCKHEGILTVKPMSGCSWGWRSILWGRDLLIKGLKWEVGNGQHIRVFMDEWIVGCDNPFVGVDVMSSLSDLRVGSLIDWRTIKWHEPLVEALFPSEVARRILATYIPKRGRVDQLYWGHSRNGDFTVKSAYFLAVYGKYPGGVGRCSPDFWKKFWAFNLPPKYSLFIWKVAHRILAVKYGLSRRNLVSDNLCGLCGPEEETVDHVFFKCVFAKKLWRCSRLNFNFDLEVVSGFVEWFPKWFKEAPDGAAFCKSVCVLWVIWRARNRQCLIVLSQCSMFVCLILPLICKLC